MSEFKCLFSVLVLMTFSTYVYAAPPGNYVLTTQKVQEIISDPETNNNGFIIKNSNTKVMNMDLSLMLAIINSNCC